MRPDTELRRMNAYLATHGSMEGFVAGPSKKRRNEESRSQQAVIKWWSLACKGFGVDERLLFAIPNGGRRDAITGALMKKEGARAGAPDLMLAAPKGVREGWSMAAFGLFIEMKTTTGHPTQEQKAMHELLRKQGYRVEICRSTEEAIRVITEYLT